MDPTSVGFVALMVILAGALCYAGDLLGRKMGKKRLTIGRLRPKHTAALMTALFGAVATLIIITILLAVSADVRTWILEGNRARTQLIQMQGQVGTLEKRGAELETENQKLAADGKKAADELALQKAELAKSVGEVARLTADTKRLAHDAANFRKQVADAQKEIGSVKAEIAKSKEEFKAVTLNNSTIVKRNEEISKRNLEIEKLNGELEKTLKQLQGEAAKLHEDRAALQKSLDDATTKFDAEIKDKTQNLNAVARSLSEASEELDRVEETLKAQQAKLDAITNDLEGSQRDLRLKPLRVNRGDELARVPVGAQLNLAEARRALNLALVLASEEAERRGASKVAGTNDFATFVNLPTENGGSITIDEQMKAALDMVMSKPRPQLVIFRSMFNTFMDEFVPIEVFVVENPTIFTEGQMVDEFDVDGTKSEQEIATVIAERASTVLRDKVVKAGLIPSIGRPQSIGELGRDTVLNLVQSIKTANRRVQVRLFAKADTRAGDVLRLDYKIR